MSLVTRKSVFGVWDQVRHKPACAATEAIWRLDISDIETGDIILPRQRTIKVLIRLRGCVGWSAPLLFAHGINRFSHDVAQITIKQDNQLSLPTRWCQCLSSWKQCIKLHVDINVKISRNSPSQDTCSSLQTKTNLTFSWHACTQFKDSGSLWQLVLRIIAILDAILEFLVPHHWIYFSRYLKSQ